MIDPTRLERGLFVTRLHKTPRSSTDSQTLHSEFDSLTFQQRIVTCKVVASILADLESLMLQFI